ncbi:MAG TPA: sulfatase-like hydrolase/transferase [Terriglobales bacterium]|nr:sulfatase-like hydrolase/transferase [Terriglobales bacterium]
MPPTPKSDRNSVLGGVYLAGFAILAFSTGGCKKREAPRHHPNVLIITVDTLRADRVGAEGSHEGLTPHIDALAKDGVVFTDAISQVPLTFPSHAAIFTGTYPFHNGVQDFTAQPLSERFRTLAESFKANGYATGAVVSSFVLDRSWGLARGFDSYDDAFSGEQFAQKDLGLVERRADASVDHAIQWLAGQSAHPFFFWLHLYDPHSPYDPPEPFKSKYKSELYDGEVAYTDSQLARLFDWMKLPPHDIYDNTIIVFMSDHGESLGEHGEKEHGFFVYDSTVRIPLIIKPAQGYSALPGGVIPTAVEAIQVGPTVLDLAGLRQDAIEKQFQASTLVPLMSGTNTAPGRPAYSETVYPQNSFGWSPLRSMQTDKYQFIEAPRQELYNLSDDPSEKTNIAAKDSTVAGRLQEQLNNRLALYQGSEKTEVAGTSGASPEVLEKLRSLGYVAYKAPLVPGAKLADPKDKLPVFQEILRATDLMHLGKIPEAQSLLATLERAEPNLYLIPFLQGEASEREQRWGEAEKHFGKSLQLNPGFEQATMGLARSLGFQGKTEQASGLLRSLLATNQGDFRAWFLLAQIEAKSDPKRSQEALNRVIDLQPNFALAFRERGMLNVQVQDYEAGAQDLSQAVRMGLSDPQTLNYLGICYSRLGRLDDAIASYQSALAKDPKLAQAHLNLGFAYERKDDLTHARQEYKDACRLDQGLCALIAQHLRSR